MIYLDNAATSMPKPPTVYGAVMRAMRTCAGSGRSGHDAARAAEQILFLCRQTAADLFECEPEQVVMTFNATHGLNMAIRTLVSPGDTVVVSGFEHNAVIRPLNDLRANIRYARGALFNRQAVLHDFSEAITPDVKAVICNHVSNVFGFVLPVEEVAEICTQRNVPLIVDASQSAGLFPLSLKRLQAAFIAMPGHKALYGPQGTGLLLCNMLPKPLLHGGTGSMSLSPYMPPDLPDLGEAGTHNVPGVAGLLAGLQFVQHKGTQELLRHDKILSNMAGQELAKLPRVQVIMDQNKHPSGVLSFLIQGIDCEDTASVLNRHGYALRAGLHCAPQAHITAGTLETGTIRISVSANNTEGEILRFIDTIHTLVDTEFLSD